MIVIVILKDETRNDIIYLTNKSIIKKSLKSNINLNIL